MNEWASNHVKEVMIKNKIWQKANPTKAAEHQSSYYSRLRLEVLQKYGGDKPRCACCGEDHVEFLAIDHINGGGNKHRRSINKTKSGKMRHSVYSWLRQNRYPDGFRILCHNCNMATSSNKICPHQREKILEATRSSIVNERGSSTLT